jgi:hypothetical protein
MISSPPKIAAGVSGEFKGGGRSWSTIATMKMVRRAATEERTGEVSEMRIRKEPENAGFGSVCFQ